MSQAGRSKILVLGDDMRVFLSVVRSLGRAGHEVHAAPRDLDAPALRSRYLNRIHQLPSYSSTPTGWAQALVQLLRENGIGLVVPCCDSFILPLHAAREELADFRVAIPTERVIADLFDKVRTRELAARLGVPVAPGAALGADDPADELVARFGLPLVIKPRQSYWIDQLDDWGKVWILHSVDEVRRILAEIDEPSRYLVEGFFSGGAGVGVSVLARSGRILQAFQHRRLREGHGTSSSYRVSEPVHDDLLQACAKICQDTELTGVCMFEFRSNLRDGSWILIETNARLWGSLPLPVALGVDFPAWLHDLLVHGREHEAVDYSPGIRSRNLLLDAHNLLSAARDGGTAGLATVLAGLLDYLAQPVRWAASRETSDSFVRDDLRPGFAELAWAARRAVRRVTSRNRLSSVHEDGASASHGSGPLSKAA
jgi:predicted ATP-grasp superfamily ATP-dependent carboligase